MTDNSNNTDHGTVLHTWEFSEFDKHDRSKRWHIGTGIVAGALVFFAAISGNFLFALIIVIGVLLTILNHRTNKMVSLSITEDGIMVGNQFYDYRDLKHFFIIYQPPEVKRLYFDPRSVFSPRIPVALDNQNPVVIRETLAQYLTEDIEQEHEPVGDQVSRFLKL